MKAVLTAAPSAPDRRCEHPVQNKQVEQSQRDPARMCVMSQADADPARLLAAMDQVEENAGSVGLSSTSGSWIVRNPDRGEALTCLEGKQGKAMTAAIVEFDRNAPLVPEGREAALGGASNSPIAFPVHAWLPSGLPNRRHSEAP